MPPHSHLITGAKSDSGAIQMTVRPKLVRNLAETILASQAEDRLRDAIRDIIAITQRASYPELIIKAVQQRAQTALTATEQSNAVTQDHRGEQ